MEKLAARIAQSRGYDLVFTPHIMRFEL